MRAGRGQSLIEYAIFIAVVAAALMSIATYVRRAVNAQVKQIEGEVNAAVDEEPAQEEGPGGP